MSDSAALPRLSKLMAERGLCSRREADSYIERGWVKVDGEVATLGLRVSPDARIELLAQARGAQQERVTILLHKPVGYVSGQAEDGYEPAVVLIQPENRWEECKSRQAFHPGQIRGLAPAGRLDIDSTGLLVLTQDGRIARQLIGDDSTVEKEYLVRVSGALSDADLRRLNHGLWLDQTEANTEINRAYGGDDGTFLNTGTYRKTSDTVTTFADKLSIPTSLLFSNGGVIVHSAPETLFLKDTDGDDRADTRRLVLGGFGTVLAVLNSGKGDPASSSSHMA